MGVSVTKEVLTKDEWDDLCAHTSGCPGVGAHREIDSQTRHFTGANEDAAKKKYEDLVIVQRGLVISQIGESGEQEYLVYGRADTDKRGGMRITKGNSILVAAKAGDKRPLDTIRRVFPNLSANTLNVETSEEWRWISTNDHKGKRYVFRVMATLIKQCRPLISGIIPSANKEKPGQFRPPHDLGIDDKIMEMKVLEAVRGVIEKP